MSLASIFKTRSQQNKIAAAAQRAELDAQKNAQRPTIYFIRHGEKPPKFPNGHDAIGLSPIGETRAQGLVDVFGRNSDYNIGYIYAQRYKPTGARKRPFDTVVPLAKHLNLNIDNSIDRDDVKTLVDALQSYKGEGNILVCWEHHALTRIMKKLKVEGYFKWPKRRFDCIWTVRAPYKQLHSWTSELIVGLDEHHLDPKAR